MVEHVISIQTPHTQPEKAAMLLPGGLSLFEMPYSVLALPPDNNLNKGAKTANYSPQPFIIGFK